MSLKRNCWKCKWLRESSVRLLCISQALWFHMPQVSSYEIYKKDFWKTYGNFPHAIFKILPFSLQADSVLWRAPVGEWITDASVAPHAAWQHRANVGEEEKQLFCLSPQLRAVTLALPAVKASLTGLHILIMPNIILTIAYISRQGVIISSDSIGRPSAGWGTIDLSGKAMWLEAN